jgi:hypothetical protein
MPPPSRRHHPLRTTARPVPPPSPLPPPRSPRPASGHHPRTPAFHRRTPNTYGPCEPPATPRDAGRGRGWRVGWREAPMLTTCLGRGAGRRERPRTDSGWAPHLILTTRLMSTAGRRSGDPGFRGGRLPTSPHASGEVPGGRSGARAAPCSPHASGKVQGGRSGARAGSEWRGGPHAHHMPGRGAGRPERGTRRARSGGEAPVLTTCLGRCREEGAATRRLGLGATPVPTTRLRSAARTPDRGTRGLGVEGKPPCSPHASGEVPGGRSGARAALGVDGEVPVLTTCLRRGAGRTERGTRRARSGGAPPMLTTCLGRGAGEDGLRGVVGRTVPGGAAEDRLVGRGGTGWGDVWGLGLVAGGGQGVEEGWGFTRR